MAKEVFCGKSAALCGKRCVELTANRLFVLVLGMGRMRKRWWVLEELGLGISGREGVDGTGVDCLAV